MIPAAKNGMYLTTWGKVEVHTTNGRGFTPEEVCPKVCR